MFKVPTTAYLKKWITRKIQNDNPGPLKIEEDTLLGKQFMSIIIDARKKDVIDQHLEHTHVIEVILSQDMMKRSPNLPRLVPINFFLDKLFKEDLRSWVLSARFYGIRPYPATKNFLEFYGIDESEYSHDAAYRYWQRWQSSQYKKDRKKKSGQPSTKVRSLVTQPLQNVA
jgi:hypothetical protein